jgi:hypothetical protein
MPLIKGGNRDLIIFSFRPCTKIYMPTVIKKNKTASTAIINPIIRAKKFIQPKIFTTINPFESQKYFSLELTR